MVIASAIAARPFEAPNEALFTSIRRCLFMLVGGMIVLVSTQKAFAHDPGHPEWNSWLMSQQNQNNGVCCDGNDTLVLGDNEWRTANDHYEVLYNGAWQEVPAWALTRSHDNITGSALLWVWHGHVRCFKPGTFY
jgi:hypothetical protein